MAWRYALAAPMLFLLGGARQVWGVHPGRVLALIAVGGGGQAVVTYLSLSALEWLPAASLGFLFYTYPAWVAILSALLGIERLTPLRIAALGLALAGISLMVGAPWNLALPLPGVLRALGAALVYAAYIPTLQRLRGPLDPAVASSWLILGAAGIFLAAAWHQGTLALPAGFAQWGLVFWLAGFSTVVAFLTFLRGLEVLGPVRSAILSTTEPFFTAVLALLILAQPLGVTTLLGGGCIIAAIMILERASPPAVESPVPA